MPQGQTALQDKQFDRAQKIYEQVVKLDPQSAEGHSNLGFALYMLGSYPRAIQEFQKALELDPSLDETEILLALSYFDIGQLQRAIPLLEKAYQRKKDDTDVAAHLGLAYLREHQADKALVVLSHWAEIQPDNPEALYYKGKAAQYVASNAFARLTTIAPDSYRTLQLEAEMLRERGLAPAAINEYKKAIAQKPNAAGLHYALGTLYREVGRLDEALAEFNQELRITDDPLTYYWIGDVYLQQNNLDRAQQSLLKALTIQPGLTGAQLDLAKTYQAQGKTALAVKTLQAVIASDPDQQEAHYLLFGLYKEQGQMDQARKELETFQRLKRRTADQEEKRMKLDSTDR
ncbi:MAG TPA: tetratricopeptide repeat protein [Bryobacteraceae bacterium]|nr:tetratricopeptide repeat protein [Bryobacteraceae bacterium]